MMEIEYLLDLEAAKSSVQLTISASNLIDPLFSPLLDGIVDDTVAVVNGQGMSMTHMSASMSASEGVEVEDRHSRQYKIKCRGTDPSVWRVMSGLLHRFDVFNLSLTSIRFVGMSGKPRHYANDQILRLPYPVRRGAENFLLEEDPGTDTSRSVEIELLPKSDKIGQDILLPALNAWLRTASGGFFEDGKHPSTNVHDCIGFENEGGQLLVARFEDYLGSEAAFDVLVNELDFFHRQYNCIQSVRMY
jgi:hypothetical protein